MSRRDNLSQALKVVMVRAWASVSRTSRTQSLPVERKHCSAQLSEIPMANLSGGELARLPGLPNRHGPPWPDIIQQAYRIVAEAYNQSQRLLRLEDGDAIRLRLHSERLSIRIWGIAHQISREIQDDFWWQNCQAALRTLIAELEEAAQSVAAVWVAVVSGLLGTSF